MAGFSGVTGQSSPVHAFRGAIKAEKEASQARAGLVARYSPRELDLSASIWCLYDSESKKHIGFR